MPATVRRQPTGKTPSYGMDPMKLIYQLIKMATMPKGKAGGGPGGPAGGSYFADPLTSPWQPYQSQGKPTPSPFQNQSTLTGELRHFAGSTGRGGNQFPQDFPEDPNMDPQTRSYMEAWESNNFDPWGNMGPVSQGSRSAYQQYLAGLPQRGLQNPWTGGLIPGSNRGRV